MRAAILQHMFRIEEHLRRGYFPAQYSNARDYIAGTRMDCDKEWGTDCEISTLSDLLNTTIYSFDERNGSWAPYSPEAGIDFTVPALYLKFVNGNHFQVVTSIT